MPGLALSIIKLVLHSDMVSLTAPKMMSLGSIKLIFTEPMHNAPFCLICTVATPDELGVWVEVAVVSPLVHKYEILVDSSNSIKPKKLFSQVSARL